MALARPGGRIGLVLPSGLATDHGSAALRHLLLTSATWTRSSASTTSAACFRFIAASASCW